MRTAETSRWQELGRFGRKVRRQGDGCPTAESDTWPRLKEGETVRLRRHERDEGDAVDDSQTIVIGALRAR